MLKRAAERVEEWRRLHKVNQITFAQLAGISVGCLQGFESGSRDTRKHNRVKIAAVLGLTEEALFGDDAPADKPDPLRDSLKTEDLRVANAYHHSDAEVKHAIKRFFTPPTSDERRERIAAVIVRLLTADDTEFLELELLILAPQPRNLPRLLPLHPAPPPRLSYHHTEITAMTHDYLDGGTHGITAASIDHSYHTRGLHLVASTSHDGTGGLWRGRHLRRACRLSRGLVSRSPGACGGHPRPHPPARRALHKEI